MKAIRVTSIRRHSRVVSHTTSHIIFDPKCKYFSTMKRLLIMAINILIWRTAADDMIAAEKDLET
jgi:hypothetical protein